MPVGLRALDEQRPPLRLEAQEEVAEGLRPRALGLLGRGGLGSRPGGPAHRPLQAGQGDGPLDDGRGRPLRLLRRPGRAPGDRLDPGAAPQGVPQQAEERAEGSDERPGDLRRPENTLPRSRAGGPPRPPRSGRPGSCRSPPCGRAASGSTPDSATMGAPRQPDQGGRGPPARSCRREGHRRPRSGTPARPRSGCAGRPGRRASGSQSSSAAARSRRARSRPARPEECPSFRSPPRNGRPHPLTGLDLLL
jgi:hypothetical protein